MLRVSLLAVSSSFVLYAGTLSQIEAPVGVATAKILADKKTYETGGLIPISKNKTTIEIPVNSWTILSFPFEIKDIDRASTSLQRQATGDVDFSSLNDGTQQPQKTQQPIPSQNDSTTINVGTNTVSIFPREHTDIKLAVWRTTGYPVLLDIKTSDDKKQAYFEFVDGYGVDKKDTGEFEANEHTKIIAELIKATYNRKPPKGYRVESDTFKTKVGGLEITGILSLIGERYLSQEIKIANNTGAEITLYEELFYEKGFFAVSFENDTLKPGESCRAFVIRGTNG